MHIRKLTDEDKAAIREVKQRANNEIKKKRKFYLAHIRKIEKETGSFNRNRSAELRTLDNQLEQLKLITCNPVTVIVGDKSICLRYGTLEKLSRSLRRSGYQGAAVIKEICALKILHIKYDNGEIELCELPSHQVRLLQGLPIIEIA